MAVPVISPTSSVLGYKQWEYFEFQPYATNSPTGWTANNALPTGLALDSSTGRISGAAEIPGVFILGLTASNGDGASAEQVFTIGIEPGALVPDSLPWLAVNTLTGAILVDGEVVPDLSDEVRNKMRQQSGFVPPFALAIKENDDLLARISFVRDTSVQDINLDSLRLVLKQFQPEGNLVVSDEAFEKQGTGTGTNFLLHAKFDGDQLAASLSYYEEDQGTYFYALAEIEYVQVNPETVGPELLVRSSATFAIRVERDLAQ